MKWKLLAWVLILGFTFQAIPGAGQTISSKVGQDQVNCVMRGDLEGNGRTLTLEWYHRGPFSAAPGNPSTYIRGVRVMDANDSRSALAQWESQPTTLPDFDAKLNGLWSVSGDNRTIIIATVQFGGATVVSFALLYRNHALQEVSQVGGRGILSIGAMGPQESLTIQVLPTDWEEMYEFYSWRGSQFVRSDEEFPEFWSQLGESYVANIDKQHPLAPFILSMDCRRAYRAFRLAGAPKKAKQPCLRALERIRLGHGIIPMPESRTHEAFEKEKSEAIKEIERLLNLPALRDP